MNELNVFKNDVFGQIRTIEEEGKILFCGSDIAKALGYSNPSKALSDHCKGITKRDTPTNGGVQSISFITEGDLYRLIASSNLPSAEQFELWVFDDVLPSIRKHGMYATEITVEKMLNDPDFAINLLTTLKEERTKRLEAENTNAILMHVTKIYTATEIAKELGFKSATELNKILSEKRIQYKQNDTWVLYSKYADKGYTEIKQQVLDNGKVIYDRKWTQLGRRFLIELFEVTQNG